jgi:hypothetical protein
MATSSNYQHPFEFLPLTRPVAFSLQLTATTGPAISAHRGVPLTNSGLLYAQPPGLAPGDETKIILRRIVGLSKPAIPAPDSAFVAATRHAKPQSAGRKLPLFGRAKLPQYHAQFQKRHCCPEISMGSRGTQGGAG